MATPSTQRRRTICFVLAFVALGCSHGRAAIGWDLKECERHFGKPVSGPFEGRHGDSHNYFFRSKPWKIEANFSDATDRVIMITYITTDKQLLQKDRDTLLRDNAPGVTKWIENVGVSQQSSGNGFYRQMWSGAAGQDHYTAIIEHDATGDYALTVIYEAPSEQKQADVEASPSPLASQDRDFTAQVTNVMPDTNDTVAVGTAKNNSGHTVYAIELSVNFYGDEGRLLDTVDAVAEGRANGILQGEVATWKAISTQNARVRRVEAVVTDAQTSH